METEKSILTREVVAISDRKKLGKLKGICVDYDTRAVSYYVVGSTSTGADLVLPFSKSLAMGDTFVTIQSREDFLGSNDPEATRVLAEGSHLVGLEVFSRAGNRLGVVEGFEFDPTYGDVTKIVLNKRLSFTSDAFVFFSSDFVFVDDGVATAHDIRTGVVKQKKKVGAKMVSKPRKATPAKTAKKSVIDAASEASKNKEVPVEEVPVEEEAPKASGEDAVLVEFLVGTVVNDTVESKDGEFKVTKGTKLTEELVAEAQKHDALLLLTMSVEA